MKKQTDPRMHSAEHILNQTMDRMFGCGRCFNAHIEKKKSKCDYHLDRELAPQEIEKIQNQVNHIIAENLPVTEAFVSPAEARDNYNTEKLPDNPGDSIRIIHIGNYDACPCIGKHVKSTAEIGEFRITTASFDDDVVRIRFKLTPLNIA